MVHSMLYGFATSIGTCWQTANYIIIISGDIPVYILNVFTVEPISSGMTMQAWWIT